MKYISTFENHSEGSEELPSFLYDVDVMKKYISKDYQKRYDILEIIEIEKPYSVYVKTARKLDRHEKNDGIRLDISIDEIISIESSKENSISNPKKKDTSKVNDGIYQKETDNSIIKIVTQLTDNRGKDYLTLKVYKSITDKKTGKNEMNVIYQEFIKK
jgi:hypothetical protein